MPNLKLEKALKLAKDVGHVFLATSGENGVPHISVVRDIGLDDKARLDLTGWFCQYTSANLENNRNVSVLIWDESKDRGYQLIGCLEKEEELSILDGYAPEEDKTPVPQIQREIHIRVEKMLNFEMAPHIDVEA